jgi:drug/metabolite transporter (DMT)-like permease
MTSPETNSTSSLSGEARLRQRSRRIRNVWIAALSVGFLGGMAFALADGGALPLSPALFWTLLALVAGGVVAVNVWFIRRVDELEVMDNLWASFVGVIAHILIGAGWVAAAARGYAPAPDVLAVLMATLVVTLLAYFGLKLRRRLG